MTRRPVYFIVLILLAAEWAHADESHLTQVVDESLRVASFGMPVVRLLDSDPVKRETGRRMVDATLINGVITQALKWTISSPRPHGGDDGFPSGHTSAAFATAMALVEREPKMAWVAFPLAATAGWARVDLERHTWAQVIAGAALGTFVGHMCGTGQWRLFGDKNAPLTTALMAEASPDLLAALDGSLPTVTRRDYEWTATVWTTAF